MSAKRAASLLTVSCAALMAGCMTPPNLGARPELAKGESYAVARSFLAPESAWPSDRWWEAYGDTQLNTLIEEALRDSPTLAAAAARVRRAEAAAQQAGAARYPSISTQSGVQASRTDISFDSAPAALNDLSSGDWTSRSSAALSIGYQLDFFGRNRASFAAATSQARAAEAEAAAARLQLSTAVAGAYAEMLRLTADRSAAEGTVRMRDDSARLVRQRVSSGVENEGQAHQADAKLAAARADLESIDAAIARTRNALAALLGKGPDRGLEIAPPAQPRIAAPGLPASIEINLIGRRPDLVAARLRAEAAAQKINAARADFYPNVNLTALVSLQTLGLDRLGGGTLSMGQVGPAVSLPIFDGGRIEGNYRGARAEYDEAVALYNQALADALKEVADAFGDRRAAERELAHARSGLASAEAAYRIARIRYEGGLISYIDTLSVEDGLVAQRRAVADLEAHALALDIALTRALGGGFAASRS
ncbi:MAG: efflux transporter outer membrane subunit [Hyphomonadaceae bacterium]|nr:efflux transporter outer membrane subunit [Hyphomonadaceae bacterium]